MTEQAGQNQINMSYDAVEDRILIRATEKGKEYRAWWTRRLALKIYQMFSEQPLPTENSGSHLAPEQRQTLGSLEKQGALQQADFSTPFDSTPEQFPLGEEGILVQRVDVKTEGKIVKFVMLPGEGEGMTLALPPSQRYSFEHMLQQVMIAGEWIVASSENRSEETAESPLAH